jgi:hypothetical protein
MFCDPCKGGIGILSNHVINEKPSQNYITDAE